MKLLPRNYHCTEWEKVVNVDGSAYYVCAVSRKAKSGHIVADQVVVTQDELERNGPDQYLELLKARFEIAVASIKAILRTLRA